MYNKIRIPIRKRMQVLEIRSSWRDRTVSEKAKLFIEKEDKRKKKERRLVVVEKE